MRCKLNIRPVWKSDTFASRAALLVGGTTFGQGVIVATSPILTRIYRPEELGIYTAVTGIIAIALTISSLCYEQAIPIPDNDIDALSLLGLSAAIALCYSVMFGTITWCLRKFVALRFSLSVDYLVITIIMIIMLSASIYRALSFWAIRKQAFRQISITKISQGVGLVLTQIILGVYDFGYNGLLAGYGVGQASGTFSLLRLVKSFPVKTIFPRLGKNAVRFWRYPAITTWATLSNSAALQVLPIFALMVLGKDVAGQLALGQRVIRAPMTLIGTAFSQIYLSEISYKLNNEPEKIEGVFLHTTLRLGVLGFIIIIPLGLAAPLLFRFIFGSSWYDAGKYVQLMTPMALGQFIVSPLSQSANVLQRQDLQLSGDIARLLVTLVVFGMGTALRWSPNSVITIYSITIATTYVLYFEIYYSLVRKVTRLSTE